MAGKSVWTSFSLQRRGGVYDLTNSEENWHFCTACGSLRHIWQSDFMHQSTLLTALFDSIDRTLQTIKASYIQVISLVTWYCQFCLRGEYAFDNWSIICSVRSTHSILLGQWENVLIWVTEITVRVKNHYIGLFCFQYFVDSGPQNKHPHSQLPTDCHGHVVLR